MRKIMSLVMILLITIALPMSVLANVSEDLDVENELVETGEKGLVKTSEKLAQEAGIKLISFERRNLVDNIYEYTFVFKVGKGEFDTIGVHRVVKEKRPWRPVETKAGVMMTPGDWMGFRATYLLSTQTDAPGIEVNHSLAIYLAENDIDVWGIDLRRSFVPDYYPGTDEPYCNHADNCTFMKDWNMGTQLSDIKCATKFARIMRLFTRQGYDKLFMLGASRGGRLTYAYANAETQLKRPYKSDYGYANVETQLKKPYRRPGDIKGIIIMDVAYKFDPSEDVSLNASKAACERYLILKSLYDNGAYYSDEGIKLKNISDLADKRPTNNSRIIPGFTNKEVGELMLSATHLFVKPPMTPRIPFYHYCEGTFNKTGHPNGLLFTNFDYMIDLAGSLVSFQSLGYMMDDDAIMCDNLSVVDVPYDDHLRKIRIPALYVGAENGYGGKYGNYTTTLLGSKDVTVHIVPGYAHIDSLYADTAESDAWEPIYKWLESHS